MCNSHIQPVVLVRSGATVHGQRSLKMSPGIDCPSFRMSLGRMKHPSRNTMNVAALHSGPDAVTAAAFGSTKCTTVHFYKHPWKVCFAQSRREGWKIRHEGSIFKIKDPVQIQHTASELLLVRFSTKTCMFSRGQSPKDFL